MKRLKTNLILLTTILVVAFATSCRDEFTEQDAIKAAEDAAAAEQQAAKDAAAADQLANEDALKLEAELNADEIKLRDSLRRLGGLIHYTVAVVDAGNAVFNNGGNRTKGTEAVSGAVVTVAQNGVIASMTTGADGLAVFNDMRIGNVAVHVEVSDFTSVDYVADLTPKGNATSSDSESGETTDLANITRNAATQIPVFPTTGANTTTISGMVTYESDFTNSTPEYPTTNVLAVIVADDDFIDTYIAPAGQNGDPYYGNEDYAGRVLRISYASAGVSGAVDATDGSYSLTVPASAQGLDYEIGTSDVIADQTLLEETFAADMQYVTGPQTYRAIYGEDVSASSIPSASGAWVSFTAPTGGVGGFGSGATATAVIGMAGTIASINVTDAGKMYTQVPDAVITGDGINGAGTAVLGTEGAVVGVTVDNAGQGYSYADVSLEFGGNDAVIDIDILASIATVNGSGNPYILNIAGLAAGDDFTTMPVPTFVNTGTGTGTGGAATAYGVVSGSSVISAPGSGYVAKYIINDGGTTPLLPDRRISGPELVISAPDFPDANDATHYIQAEGFVSLEGGITAIALGDDGTENDGDFYIMDDKTAPTLPTISISPAKGATATVAMSTSDGRLDYAWVDNGGAGYTFVPTATMTNGTSTTQSAIVQVDDMGVEAVSTTSGGAGYVRADDGDALVFSGGGGTLAAGVIELTESATGVNWTAGLPQGGYTASTNATWTFDGGGPNPADEIIVEGVVDALGFLQSVSVTTSGAQTGAGFSGTTDPAYVPASATNNIPGDEVNIEITWSVDNVPSASITPGSLYTQSPAVTFPDPTGSDLQVTNVTATGASTLQVQSLAIIYEGRGYNYTDPVNAITISGGGGSGAVVVPFFATSISSVSIGASGNFFTAVDDFDLTITHAAPTTLPPSFTTLGFNPLTYNSVGNLDDLSEVWVTGTVFAYALDDAGNGYSTAVTMDVDNTDGGTGATFDELINDVAAFALITAGG